VDCGLEEKAELLPSPQVAWKTRWEQVLLDAGRDGHRREQAMAVFCVAGLRAETFKYLQEEHRLSAQGHPLVS